MGDFRVDWTSPVEAYRDSEDRGARYKKGKRRIAKTWEDEYVSSSEQDEDGGIPAEDFYSPSEETVEPQ